MSFLVTFQSLSKEMERMSTVNTRARRTAAGASKQEVQSEKVGDRNGNEQPP